MKRKPISTPVGVAVWPKLNAPDKRWKAEGEFQVTLRLSADDAVDVIKKIEEFHGNAYSRFCQDQGKNKLKKANMPFVDHEVDEEKNGEVDFKFRLKHRVETRAGDTFTQTVALFDAKGTPMKDLVGGGSKIRVRGEMNPWFTASLGFGVSLWVKAVQVLELVEPTGNGSAESFGFNSTDGGFTTSEPLEFDEDKKDEPEGAATDEAKDKTKASDEDDF